jgi:hypothetical protein
MTQTQNQLKPAQVQQLVDATTMPADAYIALKDGPRYDDKQQQQLVDRIAKSSQAAAWALKGISWLTTAQKGQLTVVA